MAVFKLNVRDTATFDTKSQAVAWAVKREAAIVAAARGDIVPHTMRDALKRYSDDVSPGKGGSRWEVIRLAKFGRELPFVDQWLSNVQAADIAVGEISR